MSEETLDNIVPDEGIPQEQGRIEVVPEVLVSIAWEAIENHEGVIKMADIPSSVDRRRRRRLLHDGILLEIDDRQAVFDLYVVTNADFNAVKVGESLQANIVEAIDKMVGTPVAAVNVHVQDIATAPDVQAD